MKVNDIAVTTRPKGKAQSKSKNDSGEEHAQVTVVENKEVMDNLGELIKVFSTKLDKDNESRNNISVESLSTNSMTYQIQCDSGWKTSSKLQKRMNVMKNKNT